jgi:hypothetical protein
MKVVFKRKKEIVNREDVVSRVTENNASDIAARILFNTKEAFVEGSVNPFYVLKQLRSYGLFARAVPVVNSNQQLCGYRFRKAV